jgi:hypothetical protein
MSGGAGDFVFAREPIVVGFAEGVVDLGADGLQRAGLVVAVEEGDGIEDVVEVAEMGE